MRPPRVAMWLLKRFTSNEPLIGDLVEEYRRGRSHVWVWRQVLTAIIAEAWREVRDHQVLALRAIVTGWVVAWLFFSFVLNPLANVISVSVWNWTVEAGQDSVRWWWWHLGGPSAVTGLIACVGYFVSGWAVGRFHRMPMLLIYVASLLLAFAYSVVWYYWFYPKFSPAALFYWAPRLFYTAMAFIGMPLSILIGGLCAEPRHEVPGAIA